MLFRKIIFLVDIPLEGREYVTLSHEVVAALTLDFDERCVRDAILVRRRVPVFRRNGEIFELFTEDDDRLFRE